MMTRNDIETITMARGDWNKTKAFATVTLKSGLIITGVKVIAGPKGLFVGMPSVLRKNKETGAQEWKDCCYLKGEDRDNFQKIVLDEYNNEAPRPKVESATFPDDGEGYF
jgi:DNA-binding cell septation regulator SpoVG